MKFLIAGFGSIGRRHMNNLLTLGEKDLVFYRTRKSTLDDSSLKDFPVETDLQAALDHKPDAVIISNPTAKHLEVAIPAAEQGCHVFMEKPVSHSMDGIDRLQKALEKNGKQAFIGFQFRFHPGLARMKKLIQDGAVGEAAGVRVIWGEYLPGWHPWEDYRKSYTSLPSLGGGVVLTLCHPLDYLRWLFGEVESLQAYTSRIPALEIEVESMAEINLQFESGVIGNVHLNYIQRPAVHTIEVIGTSGTIHWDNSNGQTRYFDAENGKWDADISEEVYERNNLFLDEMSHFLKVIKGEENSCCDLQDGIKAMEIVSAVHESNKKGMRISLKS